MDSFISINKSNIETEHICCAFSDKKCREGYELKKDWLRKEMDNGYVFRRLDARAKVFIEYGPAENAWLPINAPNYLQINCFWVSGRYKKQGYGKKLLNFAMQDAIAQGKSGLVTVVGTKKFNFMSDTRWLLKQGFESCEDTNTGFSLLVKKIDPKAKNPNFKKSVLSGHCEEEKGLVVYYSNRCPFTPYYINTVLKETANKRGLALKVIKLESMEQAQSAPTPATIFSLFYDGKFITTDVSVCTDSQFDRIVQKQMNS